MSKEKSIYDNEKFFNSYMEIREGENNHNDLIEQPTIKRLLPDLKGKTVLELGCGYGEKLAKKELKEVVAYSAEHREW